MRTIHAIMTASTIAITIAITACGGSETSGGTSSSTSGGGGAEATTSAGASSSGSGSGTVCVAGTLCLQVTQVDAGGALASGRLAVVWYPFDTTNPTPPLVAYDAPFDPTTTRIDIPLASLAPVSAALQTGDPVLGFAMVGVGQDQDHDGKLGAAELQATMYGVGRLGVVYSQQAYHPPPAGIASVLPEGVNVGTHAYRIIPGSTQSSLDQLGIAFGGTVFDLAVCSDAPGCTVPTPKLR